MILGAVDFTHPAAPQQSDDSISLEQNSARRESSTLGRVRSGGSGLRRNGNFIRLKSRRVENGKGAPA
jgi:hypothetical protein